MAHRGTRSNKLDVHGFDDLSARFHGHGQHNGRVHSLTQVMKKVRNPAFPENRGGSALSITATDWLVRYFFLHWQHCDGVK
eukprot:3346524-Amphidinium_carterae.2